MKTKVIFRTSLRLTTNPIDKRVKELINKDIGISQNNRLVEDIYLAEVLREKYKKPIIEILAMFIDLEIAAKEEQLNKDIVLKKENEIDTESFLEQFNNI